jgi:hypothetical protein
MFIELAGAADTEPAVTKTDLKPHDVILMAPAADKHVSDPGSPALQRLETSEQAAGHWSDALEAGGSDNVTALVLRAIVRP